MSGRAGRWRGPLGRIAGLTLLLIAVATPLLLRAAWEGRAELAEAEAAAQRGRVDLEIVHLGRAARWRVPLAGHDEAALARLMAVGEEAQALGAAGSQTALMAHREARAALLATRAWSSNDAALVDAVNGKIAAAMAAQEQVFGTDLSGTGEAQAYHRALLEATAPVDAPWAGLAGLLGVMGVIGVVGAGGLLGSGTGGGRRGALLVGGGSALLLVIAVWLALAS